MEKNIDFKSRLTGHEPESPVCGNCSNFENEDAEGGGFCNEQNRMRHCSCIACNQWQEGRQPRNTNNLKNVLMQYNNGKRQGVERNN